MPERIVRPEILTSDAVNQLNWASEVFYRRLMSVVDDYGRFDGRKSIIRSAVYPLKLNEVSDADVGKFLADCAKAGLVSIYEVEQKQYLEISNFKQRLRTMKGKYPAPVSKPPTIDRKSPTDAQEEKRDEEEAKPKPRVWSEELVKARKLTCDYFSIYEVKNANMFMRVSNAIAVIEEDKQLDYYTKQIQDYFKYKDASDEKKCGIESWLWGSEGKIETGHWNREDYGMKLKSLTKETKPQAYPK